MSDEERDNKDNYCMSTFEVDYPSSYLLESEEIEKIQTEIAKKIDRIENGGQAEE